MSTSKVNSKSLSNRGVVVSGSGAGASAVRESSSSSPQQQLQQRSRGGHSVQFITPTSDGHFKVGEEAIAILSKLRCPLVVVAVVGRYRTGKSFLLNRLAGNVPGGPSFEVGPTIEACTKGIWLWSEPTFITTTSTNTNTNDNDNTNNNNTRAVIFLDTEGIGATAGASNDHDARIFALATLLSSLLIYNSVGVIDEEAVSSLGFIANLSRHVQLRSQETSSSSTELKKNNNNNNNNNNTTSSNAKGTTSSSQGKKKQKKKPTVDSDDDDQSNGGDDNYDDDDADDKRSSTGGPTSISSAAEISEFSPSFLWVLRDFTLELRDPDTGDTLSPRDYLESCLQQQEGFSSDAQARNRVRRTLTSFFKHRECVTLVRPVDDEEDLANVDHMPETSLRPVFRSEMNSLRMRVLGDGGVGGSSGNDGVAGSLSKIKTMNGDPVYGSALVGLAKAYVDAINENAVPSITNAWDSVSRTECAEAGAAAKRLYMNGMESDAHPGVLPLDVTDLEALHTQYRSAAMSMYDERAVGPSTEKYKNELRDGISTDFTLRLATNASVSETSCARIASQLWKEIIEPKLGTALENNNKTNSNGSSSSSNTRGTGVHTNNKKSMTDSSSSNNNSSSSSIYRTPEEFASDLLKVRERYFLSAKGPAVHKALALFILSAVPNVVRAVHQARVEEGESKANALETSLASVTAEMQVAVARAEAFEIQCADLRKARETGAIAAAKAEEEARSAMEKATELQTQLEEAVRERDDFTEKLEAEKLAHAATRVQLRSHANVAAVMGGGSGAGGGKKGGNSISDGAAGGGGGDSEESGGKMNRGKESANSNSSAHGRSSSSSHRGANGARNKGPRRSGADSDDSDFAEEEEDGVAVVASPRSALEEAAIKRRARDAAQNSNRRKGGKHDGGDEKDNSGGATSVDFPAPPPQGACCSVQ